MVRSNPAYNIGESIERDIIIIWSIDAKNLSSFWLVGCVGPKAHHSSFDDD